MQVTVCFYSYFKELAGCDRAAEQVAEGATLEDLLRQVLVRYPRLAPMERSLLAAVGVDYVPRSHVLRAGDEVSLFPPVQGG